MDHARGSYSFSRATFHSEHGEPTTLPVMQLELQLSARNLRRLCELAPSMTKPAEFSKGLRSIISHHLQLDLEHGG